MSTTAKWIVFEKAFPTINASRITLAAMTPMHMNLVSGAEVKLQDHIMYVGQLCRLRDRIMQDDSLRAAQPLWFYNTQLRLRSNCISFELLTRSCALAARLILASHDSSRPSSDPVTHAHARRTIGILNYVTRSVLPQWIDKPAVLDAYTVQEVVKLVNLCRALAIYLVVEGILSGSRDVNHSGVASLLFTATSICSDCPERIDLPVPDGIGYISSRGGGEPLMLLNTCHDWHSQVRLLVQKGDPPISTPSSVAAAGGMKVLDWISRLRFRFMVHQARSCRQDNESRIGHAVAWLKLARDMLSDVKDDDAERDFIDHEYDDAHEMNATFVRQEVPTDSNLLIQRIEVKENLMISGDPVETWTVEFK